MFQDRDEAGHILSQKLLKFKSEDCLVLAVPRGGVPLGYVIACELGKPLDLIFSKKISHPSSPEYAIGSVSLNETVIEDDLSGVSEEYINGEEKKIRDELNSKHRLFLGGRKPKSVKDKTLIIVDDGLATGYTMLAAIKSLRSEHPKKIIVAIPVAPPTTASKLKLVADEFICLMTPTNFQSVGQFYEDFSQITDQKVIHLMRSAD